MDIQILSKSKKRLSVEIDGIDTELVNALRRVILTEVPAMAISEVVFIENSTPLFDEIIAHRLGLIPLVTDLDSYVLPERCECEGVGCDHCTVELQCSISAAEGSRNVYSEALFSSDPKVVPVSDKILISKMSKGSKLMFEAYAHLGLGRVNAKYQSTCRVTYKMFPDVIIDQDALKKYEYLGDNENDPIVKFCPKKILKWEGKKLIVTDIRKCTLCEACARLESLPPGAIIIKPVKNKFILFIEGTGVIEPERILQEAIQIFQDKVKRFGTLVKEIQEQQQEIVDYQ